jgi:hypothetical protein
MNWWWRGSGGPGVLVHDTPADDPDNAPFRWIRAPEAEMLRKQRARTTGAFVLVVLVAAILSAEVRLERPYGRQMAGHYIQNASVEIPPLPRSMTDPAEAVAGSTAARLAPHVPTVAAALTSMRALETRTMASREVRAPSGSRSSVAARRPRITLASRKHVNQSPLVPGASKVATESPPARARHPRQERELPASTASVAPAKSYEALRDFVLSSGWYALQVARNPRATY